MARRSPWMNQRAEFLVRVLADRHGMRISEDAARDDISEHVDLVAEAMRIGRQAAKYYVTEDVISDMADRIAAEVNRRLTKDALDPRPFRIVR